MEIIKTGDVPALISNAEVMKIIQNNIQSAKKQSESNKTIEDTIDGQEEYMSLNIKQKRELKNSSNSKLKQKKWMEDKVLEYIQSTPCVNVDFDTLPKLVKRLRAPKIKSDAIKNDISSTDDNFGLTDAETLQILNLMPQELVEYHLIVDDISSRMSDERQNELIHVVKEYIKKNDENKEDGDDYGNDLKMEAEAIFSAHPANGDNGYNHTSHDKTSNGNSSTLVYIKEDPDGSESHIRVKTEPVS